MAARNNDDVQLEQKATEIRFRSYLWLADVLLLVWTIFLDAKTIYKLQCLQTEGVSHVDGLTPRQYIEKMRQGLLTFTAIVWCGFLCVAVLRWGRLIPIPVSPFRLVYTFLMALAAIVLTQRPKLFEQDHSDFVVLEILLYLTFMFCTLHVATVTFMMVAELFATNNMPVWFPLDPRTGIYAQPVKPAYRPIF